MRKLWKFLKSRRFRKFSNGAISIFLCVILAPFITIALVIVQTAHLHSAQSILDEAMGISANAALAHYDEYLQERFGLYAMEQSTETGENFNKYLESNIKVLGGSIELQDVNVEVSNALSDLRVLRQQLEEFNRILAPGTLAVEMLNIQELIDKLEKLGNLEDMLEFLTGGLDTANDLKDAYDSLAVVMTHAAKLEDTSANGLKGKYDTAYTELETAVKELSEALPPPTDPEADGYAEKIAEIAALRAAVTEKKANYMTAIDNISAEVVLYGNAAVDAQNKAKALMQSSSEFAVSFPVSDLEDEEDSLKNDNKTKEKRLGELKTKVQNGQSLNDAERNERTALETAVNDNLTKISELGQQIAASKAASEVNGQFITGSGDMFSDATVNTINLSITSLSNEKTNTSNINENADTLSELPTTGYHSGSLTGSLSAANIENYLKQQAETVATGMLTTMINAVKKMTEAIFDMETFYDSDFSANIDMAYYGSIGGLPGGNAAQNKILEVIKSIGGVIASAQSVAESAADLDIFGIIGGVIDFINSTVELINDIIDLVNYLVDNITDLFTNGYEKLCLSTYNAYNMPSRVDESVIMTQMTPDLPDASLMSTFPGAVGDISAFADMIISGLGGSGDDLAFNQAELEYTIAGSSHEILNQSIVFAELYFLRLILDAIPIMFNSEVRNIAAGTGPVAPVIYVVELFAEPLTDVLLLVNGGETGLIRTKIHLTPSGIVPFMGEFLSGDLLGEDTLEEMGTAISLSSFGFAGAAADGDDGILQLNYRDHCFLLLLLTVSSETQAARISNIIQMEGTHKYGKESGFKLADSYTNISATAGAKYKQFMPSLLPESLFDATGGKSRKVFRGY